MRGLFRTHREYPRERIEFQRCTVFSGSRKCLNFDGKIERIESKTMTYFKYEYAIEKKKRKKPRE